MAVEVRELTPAAHVRGLIEDADQRHCEPPPGRTRGLFLSCLDYSHRECRDERPGGAPALLGERVERAAVADELRRAELSARVDRPLRGDPSRDRSVRQAREGNRP